VELDLRKGVLYGISEVERGSAYLRELHAIADLTARGIHTDAGIIVVI
jgi:hypothetical protein